MAFLHGSGILSTLLPQIATKPYIILPGEEMRCPSGHLVDKHVWVGGSPPNLVQRCQHKHPGAALVHGKPPAPCNLCWWWVLMPGQITICVPMTSSDAHKLEEGGFDIVQILELVGLRAPWQVDEAA